jgi:hypothetical protein
VLVLVGLGNGDDVSGPWIRLRRAYSCRQFPPDQTITYDFRLRNLYQRSILLKSEVDKVGAAPQRATAPISSPSPEPLRGRGRHHPRMNCGSPFRDRHMVDHKFFLSENEVSEAIADPAHHR